ncbi:MAG: insulinase family protein [Phycisphaerae bacterium]|nr:insulinase family protein [Phycisphaerae bacterium]
MKHFFLLLFLLSLVASHSFGGVEPDVFTLDNGMKFILLPRTEEQNSVAVGWVAKVGSVNERPGITGISHFFEHLMFKGTNKIGTNNPDKDMEFIVAERDVRNRMLALVWGGQYEKFRRGEINDPWDSENDTPQLASLRVQLKSLMDKHADVIVKNELDSLYQGEGAVGMNAFTSEDVTFYINQLPANKIELWCWLESDRLANSVFRGFFSERDVVHEERRMRTDSTPTGVFQEQFNSMFWQASPYSWPVIGWPSDLNSYTLEGAQEYFDIYYQPSNLVGVVVGDFDLVKTRLMIKEYFGALEPGSTPPPPVPTIEPVQRAPQRMVAEVDSQSEVEVRYHGVPAGHSDGFVLEIMAGVLNGKTGRLYKSMVERDDIATNAGFRVDGKKYAGAVSFYGTAKGDATPESLEAAWYEQVSLLQNEMVSKEELEKVKNNVIADQYRQLQSNFYLMIQLGYMEALGGWEYINYSGERLLAVTAEEILGVANKYLLVNNSSVAIYNRSEDAPPVNEGLAGFGSQEQMMIQQALDELSLMTKEELLDTQQNMSQQSSSVPEEMKPVFDYLLLKLKERIKEVSVEEPLVVDVAPEDTFVVKKPAVLELTPQQLGEANKLIVNLENQSLGDLIQIYAALEGAMGGVPEEERPILEYVIARLAVIIAELEE